MGLRAVYQIRLFAVINFDIKVKPSSTVRIFCEFMLISFVKFTTVQQQ